jgi:hypothetical protein
LSDGIRCQVSGSRGGKSITEATHTWRHCHRTTFVSYNLFMPHTYYLEVFLDGILFETYDFGSGSLKISLCVRNAGGECFSTTYLCLNVCVMKTSVF